MYIAIVLIQLMIWGLCLILSDPNSDNSWEIQTKKQAVNWFIMCFVPLLPVAMIIWKSFNKFK